MRKCVLIINLYTIRRKCHMIAESAQPRNPNDPFSRSGWGLGTRLDYCCIASLSILKNAHHLTRKYRAHPRTVPEYEWDRGNVSFSIHKMAVV